MQLGMIGLGRMGANMVRRLMQNGHDCVVYDRSADAINALIGEGAAGAKSLPEFVEKLQAPRVVWLMLPAAAIDSSLQELSAHLQPGDMVIDGGNSYYIDDMRRAKELAERGLKYVDVGTSGLRAAIVRPDATVDHAHYQQLLPTSPAPGFVEFDASAMAKAARAVNSQAMGRELLTSFFTVHLAAGV